MARRSSLSARPVLALLVASALVAPAQEPGGNLTPRGGDGLFPESRSADTAEELPAPFERLVAPFELGRYHERLTAARGRDPLRSDKPAAPELPLAVFFESIRPLGALQYESQLNYFVAAFTGTAPTLQTLTYEYVFADWHAARLEVIAPGGRVESLGFGYQRTLGVGPRGNWAHGALVLPEVAVNGSGFVGGTALYTLAWKPDRESPWTVAGSAGANRASFANRPLGGAEGGVGSMQLGRPGLGGDARPEPAEEEARVWRPFASLNGWYTFSPRWTVGTEADVFPHPQFGEYLVMPNLTWRPTRHFFLQIGAGYYQIGSRGQATFQCRVNLLDPSPRRAGGE